MGTVCHGAETGVVRHRGDRRVGRSMCQVVMVITVPTVWEQKEQARVGGGAAQSMLWRVCTLLHTKPTSTNSTSRLSSQRATVRKMEVQTIVCSPMGTEDAKKVMVVFQDWLELAGSQGIQQRHGEEGQGRGPMACQPRPSFGPTPRSWVN